MTKLETYMSQSWGTVICGPVALMNSLIWAGYSPKEMFRQRKLYSYCGFSDKFGTIYQNFQKGVKYIENISDLTITEIQPSFRNIRDILEANNSVIIQCYLARAYGTYPGRIYHCYHYMNIVDYDDNPNLNVPDDHFPFDNK